jgi:hypothetical protein
MTAEQMNVHLRRRMRGWRVISVICFALIALIGLAADTEHSPLLGMLGGILFGVALTCLALSDSLQELMP